MMDEKIADALQRLKSARRTADEKRAAGHMERANQLDDRADGMAAMLYLLTGEVE